MDDDREGLPIGPSRERLRYPAEELFTGEQAAFWQMVVHLFNSFEGDDYDGVPWQFREPGTAALAMYDPA